MVRVEGNPGASAHSCSRATVQIVHQQVIQVRKLVRTVLLLSCIYHLQSQVDATPSV